MTVAPWDDTKPTIDEVRRPPKKLSPAALHQLSEVDSVVFGVDLDGSDAVEKNVRRSKDFAGAAGGTSREINTHAQQEWAHRKGFEGFASATHSEVDEVVFGVDLDNSTSARALSEHPEFADALGISTGSHNREKLTKRSLQGGSHEHTDSRFKLFESVNFISPPTPRDSLRWSRQAHNREPLQPARVARSMLGDAAARQTPAGQRLEIAHQLAALRQAEARRQLVQTMARVEEENTNPEIEAGLLKLRQRRARHRERLVREESGGGLGNGRSLSLPTLRPPAGPPPGGSEFFYGRERTDLNATYNDSEVTGPSWGGLDIAGMRTGTSIQRARARRPKSDVTALGVCVEDPGQSSLRSQRNKSDEIRAAANHANLLCKKHDADYMPPSHSPEHRRRDILPVGMQRFEPHHWDYETEFKKSDMLFLTTSKGDRVPAWLLE